MKKIFSIFCVILCLLVFGLKTEAYQIKSDIKTKRIPMGTKLELEMANNILSDNVSTGDMFTAYLTRDVRTKTTMILPRGTVVRGTVVDVIDPKRLSRSAVLYLNFNHVVAPNGAQLPIKAGLAGTYKLDENGGIKAGGNYFTTLRENADKSGAMIKKATNWGKTSGEDLFTGGRFLVTPIAAVGGVAAGGCYLVGSSIGAIFKKGKSVYIRRGEVFDIMLLDALDVPVSE